MQSRPTRKQSPTPYKHHQSIGFSESISDKLDLLKKKPPLLKPSNSSAFCLHHLRLPSHVKLYFKDLRRRHMSASDSGSPEKKIEKMGSSHAKSSSSSKKQSKGKSSSDKSKSASLHPSIRRGSYNDPGASSSAGPSSSQDLPRSVRNAPPELRTAIRRRQNNESAKRSRERKREEQVAMQQKFFENSERIEKLEKQVDDLTDYLSKKKGSKKKDHTDDPGSSSGKPGRYGDPF